MIHRQSGTIYLALSLGMISFLAGPTLIRLYQYGVAYWHRPMLAANSCPDLTEKRRIQKAFRELGQTVAIEDIVSDAEISVKKTCEQSRICVWVPFRYNVPYFGWRVYESCWSLRQ